MEGHFTPRFSGGPRSGPSAAFGCWTAGALLLLYSMTSSSTLLGVGEISSRG